MDGHLNPYWIMRKFLVKTMMERETIGDFAHQVLSNLREDMQRNMDILEGVIHLEKSPFVCGSVNGISSSVSPEKTPPANDENLPAEYNPSIEGSR